jgi:hypothetical protein
MERNDTWDRYKEYSNSKDGPADPMGVLN